MNWKQILDEMKTKMQSILAKAKAENRAFTAAEQTEFDACNAKAEEASNMIKAEAAAVVPPVAQLPAQPANDADAVKKALAVQKSLRATAKAVNVSDDKFVDELLDQVANNTKTEAQAMSEIIAKHQEGMQPAGGARVDIGVDASDKFRAAATIIMARAGGLSLTKEEQTELPKTGMANMGLQDFCRDILVKANVRGAHMLSGDALYSAMCNRPRGAIAQGTDDFAAILENVLNKSLSSGWAETASTWDIVCGRESVNDFRAHNMIAMSAFSDVEEIPEGSGATYGRMTDKKESVTVKTYGKAWSCTRQMIVNDDMGAFVQAPRLMAGASKRKIETVWIDLLTSATFAGPTMTETSRAFFNTTDGNYLDAAGAAPSVSTIAAGALAMMTRPILKANDKKSSDIPSGVEPAILFVPAAIKVTAEQLVMSVYDPADAYQKFNPYKGLRPVASALLNAKSTTRWYLFANPVIYPAFVVAFLKGVETPTARTREGSVGEPLGFIHDIYHDFAVAAREWRYAYQSKGAA